VQGVLAICVTLATLSIAAVFLGLFDQLIESLPGRGSPSSATSEGAARRVDQSAGADDRDQAPEGHRAIYRDGKLYLEGAVPSEEISAAFEAKAAEVIGADNVVNNYVIDPRAAVPTDGRVVVDEPFLFRFDSARIDPRFHGLLDLGVLVMNLNPQATMRVVGHADATGSTRYNDGLSRDRADSVAAYLVEHGIDDSRVEVDAKGERQPVADNGTRQGRAQNRRIEIELLNLLG